MEIVTFPSMYAMIFRISHEKILLFTTNKTTEKIYCDLRGKISKFLNKFNN
jgi:hypothetical protein